ncbi:retrovirus-related pol polyprotein from transposon TNT 1-94 [Tanacetum coccineum]
MKKTRILTRLYSVTTSIVLCRNLFKARHITQQDYNVTTYHGFVGYPIDYRVTLGFDSIAGGLDHVNPVIRKPLECGISMVTQNNEERTTEVLQCKLPPKEQILGNFTLPCTIGNFNFYAMANLRASVNVMPRGMFEFLKLTNLRKTNMLIEVADMTKKAPLGMVENILVGIDKFLFSSDFVIIIRTPNETIILGRPFLATIHAKIYVFNREISLGVGNDRIMVDMEKKDHNFMIPTEKILMMNSISNNEPSCPPGNPSSKSLKTDNLQDRQEQHVKKILRLDEYIPVKHLYKPIVQTYNGNVRMWPTCDPDKSICDGGVEINGRTRAGNLRIWDYTIREWMIVKVGHTNVNKSVKKALLKSQVINCFKEALDPDKDPRERSFDDYKWVFDLEIEQLVDEYELGIGKKGHILDMIWENCKNIQGKAKE